MMRSFAGLAIIALLWFGDSKQATADIVFTITPFGTGIELAVSGSGTGVAASGGRGQL